MFPDFKQRLTTLRTLQLGSRVVKMLEMHLRNSVVSAAHVASFHLTGNAEQRLLALLKLLRNVVLDQDLLVG